MRLVGRNAFDDQNAASVLRGIWFAGKIRRRTNEHHSPGIPTLHWRRLGLLTPCSGHGCGFAVFWSNALTTTRVLALPKYGRQGASSRLRTLQYQPWLERAGLEFSFQALVSDAHLQKRYRKAGYGVELVPAYLKRISFLLRRREFDVLWIEKEALPWWPLWVEESLLRGVPYVLDYDDAVFHNYDMHHSAVARRAFGRRLDGLMANAALVIGGNEYLAQRARDAGATKVEVIPTVIDLERYAARADASTASVPVIVWIGSPSTVRYLAGLSQILAALARKVPFTLRVIGATLTMPGVAVECVPWSESSEVRAIREGDFGIMPLIDTPWERGKCGYKLIQYMGCELPVVATPVGVNVDIVRHGVTGYLAHSQQEWTDALTSLLTSPELRARMGREGRRRVEDAYCIQKTAPRLIELLRDVAAGGAKCAG